jgi:hypothetical protein
VWTVVQPGAMLLREAMRKKSKVKMSCMLMLCPGYKVPGDRE